MFVGGLDVRVVGKLIGGGDTGRQIGRSQDRKRDESGEKAGSDAGGILGARHSQDEFRVRRRGMEVGEGVDVNGIGRMTPGLYLLCHFLRVWRGEDANYASGLQGLG